MKFTNIYNLTIITACLALLVMAGCKKDDPEKVNKATPTLYQTIGSDPNFSLYRAALKQAGIYNAETFSQGGPFTVFAARDSAFIKAGYTLDNINKADPQILANVLKYGMVYGRISSQSLAGFYNEDIRSKDTADAKPRVSKNYYGIFIDGIPLITGQSKELNDGVLHEVQRLPQPPVDNIYGIISKSPDLTIFAAMLRKLNMDTQLSLPPVYNPYQPEDDGNFHYTLFAPTDEAFKKLGFPDVNAINNAPINLLNNLIGQYLIRGERFTSDFKGGYSFFFGAEFTGTDGLTIYANGTLTVTNIIRPDIMATNGVIHIVDQAFTVQ